MRDTYDTPNKLRAALSGRAKIDARLRGVPTSHLQDQFTFQRFLARVFSTDDG